MIREIDCYYIVKTEWTLFTWYGFVLLLLSPLTHFRPSLIYFSDTKDKLKRPLDFDGILYFRLKYILYEVFNFKGPHFWFVIIENVLGTLWDYTSLSSQRDPIHMSSQLREDQQKHVSRKGTSVNQSHRTTNPLFS